MARRPGRDDDGAAGVANEFTTIPFSIDSDSVTVIKERALPLTTGALHDELATEDQSFSTDVQSSSLVSTPTILNTSVRNDDS